VPSLLSFWAAFFVGQEGNRMRKVWINQHSKVGEGEKRHHCTHHHSPHCTHNIHAHTHTHTKPSLSPGFPFCLNYTYEPTHHLYRQIHCCLHDPNTRRASD
jgi:hypothetical protein